MPLAIAGLVLFAVLIVLIAILFLQQAVGVVRLFRSARVTVELTRGGGDPLEAPAPTSAADEKAAALPDGTRPGGDTPAGWGFDDR
jgi:hypothetical protein